MKNVVMEKIASGEIETGQQLKDFLGPELWEELCKNLAEALVPEVEKRMENKKAPATG